MAADADADAEASQAGGEGLPVQFTKEWLNSFLLRNRVVKELEWQMVDIGPIVGPQEFSDEQAIQLA